MAWIAMWLVGCGSVDCDEGFGKASDGNCYLLTSAGGEVPGVMTYAARIYDLSGELADCVSWGHDPEGFIEDGYELINPRPFESEFQTCRVAQVAR